ncbi:MAG: hypothetical protein J6T06_10225, partial [Victivallales bacterium]|nr:hypothetical protein [Victivallales bacterium]
MMNLLLMTLVGATALNGQEWRFNGWRYNGKNPYAMTFQWHTGRYFVMDNLWTLEFADVLPETKKKTISAKEFLSEPWNGTVKHEHLERGWQMTYESDLLSMTVTVSFLYDANGCDMSARIN